jgi:hypothetical protein
MPATKAKTKSAPKRAAASTTRRSAAAAAEAPVMAPTRAATTAGKCTEFSVSFALLTSDNNRQVSFGVTRGCLDANTPLYVISFLLRDRIGGDFQDRVRLLVTLGPESGPKAQEIMDRGLRSTQKAFLEGPITTRARVAPAGTTESTPVGRALATQLGTVVNK